MRQAAWLGGLHTGQLVGLLVYIILRFLNDFKTLTNALWILDKYPLPNPDTPSAIFSWSSLIKNAKAIRLKISTDPAHTHYLKIPPAHKLAKGCALLFLAPPPSCYPAGKYAMGSRCPCPGLEIWQTIMRSSFITNARQL